jgi:hypothetical protein
MVPVQVRVCAVVEKNEDELRRFAAPYLPGELKVTLPNGQLSTGPLQGTRLTPLGIVTTNVTVTGVDALLGIV